MCDSPVNLRKSMKQIVIEVFATDSRRAEARLETCKGITAVEAFGQRLHATALPGTDPKAIRTEMELAGIVITEVRVVSPSLEDAFISALEDSEKNVPV